MKKQDKKLFEKRYGSHAETVIAIFQELEKYSRTPRELLKELRRLESTLDCLDNRSNNPERIRNALQDYVERLRVNKGRGLPIQIYGGDLSIVFKSEFSALCAEGAPPERRNVGKRIYTGQTEVPGSNVGYGPMKL